MKLDLKKTFLYSFNIAVLFLCFYFIKAKTVDSDSLIWSAWSFSEMLISYPDNIFVRRGFLGEIFETLVKVDIALSHAKEREKKGDNSTLYVFGHESRLIGKPREIYEKTKGKFEIHDYTNKDWEKIQEDNSLVSMHSWITPSSNVWKQLNEGRFLIHDEELTM